jgi:hypothetical protein
MGLVPARPAWSLPGYDYLPATVYPYYYGGPWILPQSRRYKTPNPYLDYEFPKLGLQYNYPNAIQLGIQLPPETDAPVEIVPYMPIPEPAVHPSIRQGISLMRQGKYAAAGKLFARSFHGVEAPPDVFLLIAESLVAVGKTADAEIVLRHAVDTAGDLAFLDQADLPGKFASPEVMKEKLEPLKNPEKVSGFLRGTLQILAGEKKEGIMELRKLARKDPTAKRVYLHFLDAAFSDVEPEKETGAAPEARKKSLD